LSGAPLRCVHERPGELLHVDVKRRGRVPDGGGHRMLGPSVAVDDATRLAFIGVHAHERTATTVRFMRGAVAFFADHGVRIERAMTDNAMTYTQSRQLAATFVELGIRHLRTRDDRRPMARPSASSAPTARVGLCAPLPLRLASLPRWLDNYNRRRPHAALGGLSPLTVLVTKVNGNDI